MLLQFSQTMVILNRNRLKNKRYNKCLKLFLLLTFDLKPVNHEEIRMTITTLTEQTALGDNYKTVPYLPQSLPESFSLQL